MQFSLKRRSMRQDLCLLAGLRSPCLQQHPPRCLAGLIDPSPSLLVSKVLNITESDTLQDSMLHVGHGGRHQGELAVLVVNMIRSPGQ